MTTDRLRGRTALLAVLIMLLGFGWWLLALTTHDALVVYCAHDLQYAESVLRDFEQESGIRVVIQGDTEATKSLGLIQRLIREKDAPVCDVFWNNQLLGTVQLANEGVLEPYQGAGWKRMPDRFRDRDGLWTGFGGRLRVWIVSASSTGRPTDVFTASETNLFDRMVIATPIFGTTLSHYTVLWDQLGPQGLKDWHAQFKQAGGKFVSGNATVKDLVVAGTKQFGMTDTDDFFVAQDAHAPVEMLPLRTPRGETICIPNTVAIIRGTRRRAAAERLVDYLTSATAELRMAQSKSRQIPLGPVNADEIPDDVRPLLEWASESVELQGLSAARMECLAWLTREFAP
jgi:iron(III) transport system substrate-binding protein